MNQNLLIVDDEEEILSWLEELFRYEPDLNIDVYTAASAPEAIKLLAKVRFDVVLTDISMPGMDGITLFRHIKENWPRCKTVFLTGYRNFEDLYRIVNHQDVKYILKSEDDGQILNAVREFLAKSRQELETERNLKEQKERLEEAKYWLRRELINRLCAGSIPENPEERTRALGIPLDLKRPMLPCLLRIEQDWEEEPAELLMKEEYLTCLLQENVPLRLQFYVHIFDHHQLLLLVQPTDGAENCRQTDTVIVQGAVEYAQEQFHNLKQATFSAVMEQEPVRAEELSRSLRRMKQYMVGVVGGAREVILKTDGSYPAYAEKDSWDAAAGAALRNQMEMRKKQEYFTLLGSILRKMTNRTGRHDAVALEIYYGISVFLLQFINENRLNEQLAFRLGLYKLTVADAHGNWTEAARYLTEVSETIFVSLESNESTLSERALSRVVSHIEAHLEEDLSLTTLAEVGGFNASYLSRLFKQQKGENIRDFILHKRIGLAKELLREGRLKIQDIALRTGWLSPHSFTRAFRSEVGLSPTEYREMKLGERSHSGQPM